MSNIISKIIHKPEKIFYGFQALGLMNWMNDEQYIKFTYRLIYGRRLNLKDPKAYTEKLAWCKLYWRNPLARMCADKYKVREYVKNKLGAEAKKYLNEIYGVWDNLEEIDLKFLPNRFVLKPTNGSGDIVICNDKSEFDFKVAKKKLLSNVKHHFASRTKEWVYYDLPRRFIAEKYISSSDNKAIKDYKFFCFYGEPRFLYVCSERNTNPKFDFYDMNWNAIPVINGHQRKCNIEKPELFQEMVALSRKLSSDFPHVRVDLYHEEGEIIFGELTFFHLGGFTKFEPDKYDFEFGDYFNLSKIPKNEIDL